jgi:hypothetical protein
MSSFLNQGVSAGQAGYGLYGQLDRAINGDPKKVQFVQGNVTVVEFDASLNESHSISTQPTDFAIEDGQSVCDHIRVAPLDLQLSVVKTDTPIDNRDELIRSGVVAAASAVGGPIGTLAAAAALQQNTKYVALQAQNKSQSPSQQAYEAVSRLAAGTPSTSGLTQPQVFDVITSLKRYPSMCIKNMSVQKDGSTGYAVVFQLQLQQVRLVSSQTVEVSAPAQPALSGVKKKLAEKTEPEDDAVAIAGRQGALRADNTIVGKKALQLRPDAAE